MKYLNKKIIALKTSPAARNCAENILSHNIAFVFLKPHVFYKLSVNQNNMPEAQKLIRDFFEKYWKKYDTELIPLPSVPAHYIASKGLAAKQYFEIAKAGAIKNPEYLNLDSAALQNFETKFGFSWEMALKNYKVFSAAEYINYYSEEPAELEARSLIEGTHAIGEGIYMTLLQADKTFVINPFWPKLEKDYLDPRGCIEPYLAVFKHDWKKFRTQLVGATNPEKAAGGSLRKLYWKHQQIFHFKSINTRHNVFHASRSPLEALREQWIWQNIGFSLQLNPLSLCLLRYGVSQEQIFKFMNNPVVTYQGKTQPLFEQVANTNTYTTFEILLALAQDGSN